MTSERQQLMQWLADSPGLRSLWEQVQASDHGDTTHGCGHCLRVAVSTLRLAAPEVPPAEAIAAALLHDLVNVPKDSPMRSQASEISAQRAAPMLAAAGFAEPAIERICEAIRDHSYSRGAVPRTALAKALQDADRLEALGAIGVFRTVATGVRMGASFFDDDDPFASQRQLDDRQHTVDHFFVKLLRLAATMTTAAGRAEAQQRAEFMRDFLIQLGDELGVPLPAERR